MFRWIVGIASYHTPLTLKPTSTPPGIHLTPTLTVTPSPTTQISFDLTTFLLILTLLTLAGLITWIIWMFGTGRWVSARKLAANAARVNIRPELPEGIAEANIPPPVQSPISIPPSQVQLPNLLQNKPFLSMAEECAELFHEFDGLFLQSDPRQEVAKLTMHRLQDILQRSGVETISQDRTFDIYRHQLVPPDQTVAPGTPIARVISPGFVIGKRVLIPAKVQVVPTDEKNIERDS